MKRSKFVLHTSEDGKPYFTYEAGNGECVLTSETYSSNQAMLDTVNSLSNKKFPTTIVDERGKK